MTTNYCPQCTEILDTHFCFNCGWDPMWEEYKVGDLAVADWESRWLDHSDVDYDIIPF